MTEQDSLTLNITDEFQSEKILPYSFRDGVIFLIDTTEPMFEIDPESGTTYFSQCLTAYKNILSEKLSWNKTDWMGIILMGTNKWDQDPEIKNVLSWQPFQEASIDQMKKIDETLNNLEDFHNEIGSAADYPLYDALWHATRCFNAIKIKMPYRSIILLTRSDNPSADDPAEQYRIRIKATDCIGLNIRLSVVGLGKEWKPNKFFSEIEVALGKFDNTDDYRRTYLTDLEEEVKHASRITAKLQWTLGNGVKFGVSMSTITAKTKFPQKIRLKKENNEPLDRYSYYKQSESGYLDDDEEGDDEEDSERVKVALPKNVYKYQSFGERDIKLSMAEAFTLPNSREPGIELLGFKPQSSLDLSCHLEPPKFISYNETELKGSKALFAALLKQCDAKNVIAICAVTMRSRSGTHLYAMIPHITYGGFYAYKLPLAENVRNLAQAIPQHVYNKTDHLCPINEKTVNLCEKFIKKSTIAYDPTMFLNPRLHAELANIESLAMDKDMSERPHDSTIPDKAAVLERLGELSERFKEVILSYDSKECSKRPNKLASDFPSKLTKLNMPDFKELVDQGRVDKCTVQQLKKYLESVGVNPVGKKSDLVNLVYNLYGKI